MSFRVYNTRPDIDNYYFVASVENPDNSTIVPVVSGATYVGTGSECVSYPYVSITVKTDQNGKLYIDFSPDNENWDVTYTYNYMAPISLTKIVAVAGKYVRVRFENTSITDQSYFRLQTIFGSQSGSETTLNTIQRQTKVSPFGQSNVTENTPIITLKSTNGISELRDRVKTTTGGSVIGTLDGVDTGEYKIATDTTASAKAILFTSQRALYQAGYAGLAGLGVRCPDTPDSGQTFYWGYGEDPELKNNSANGLYFLRKSDGMYISIRRQNTTPFEVPQSEWNIDPMDGSGPSGAVLNPDNGNIYHIEFTWYGYGPIIWSIIDYDQPERQVIVHVVRPTSTTSITVPNLPLMVGIINNDATTSSKSLYVAGRQFSIVGKRNIVVRSVSESVSHIKVDLNDSTYHHLISFRRKNSYISNSIYLGQYNIIYEGAQTLVVSIRVLSSLNGSTPVFGIPSSRIGYDAETAVQSFKENTIMAGVNPDPDPNPVRLVTAGIIVWEGLLQGASSGKSNKEIVLSKEDILDLDIPTTDSDSESQPIVSLCIRSLRGDALNVNIDAMFTLREEW